MRGSTVLALGAIVASVLACSSAQAPASIPTLAELSATSPPETCTLELWEDGDTPYVRCADGEQTIVRMVGIDTAESAFDENSRRRGEYQAELWHLTLEQVFACGKAATRRARELCPEGSEVQVAGSERGKYGRRLAIVVCHGVNLNLRLVEEGHAGRYPYPGKPEKPSGCPPVK